MADEFAGNRHPAENDPADLLQEQAGNVVPALDGAETGEPGRQSTLRFLQEVDRIIAREGFKSERSFLLTNGLNPVLLHKLRKGLAKPNAAHLKPLNRNYGLSPRYVLYGEEPAYGEPEEIELAPGVVMVPYVRLAGRAGSGEVFDDDVFEKPTDFFPVYTGGEQLPKDSVVFPVFGDSMEPQLRHGAQVLCRPVPKGQWKYQHEGVYAVRFGQGSNHFVIKRIKGNQLLQHNILTLHSDNPQAGGLVVPGEELIALYKVESIVSSRVV